MKPIVYKHPRRPDLVIEEALRTLGLDRTFLLKELGLPESSAPRWTTETLGLGEWIAICEILYLDLESFQYGYCRNYQLAGIREARDKGELLLPRTTELRGILRELRTLRRESDRFWDKHYGFRLRWKVRFQNLKDRTRRLPRILRAEVLARFAPPVQASVDPRLSPFPING